MQNIAAERDGKITLLPETLYSTIKKVLANGLLEDVDPPAAADSNDARRRYDRVTRRGQLAAEAETRRMLLLVNLGKAFLS
jgi:hypothetical protein